MSCPAVRTLIITHAAPPEGMDPQALAALTSLRRLLARWQPDPALSLAVDPSARSLPHELALARAHRLPSADGALPFAAARAAALGLDRSQAWGFVSPCHWQAGADHLQMHHPAGLRLSQDESALLRELMAPWFESEGIRLLPDPDNAGHWLACGEPLRGLLTASPDRASGRGLDAWMPEGPSARLMRRLQSEMQMLLYQHPLHDERRARGEHPVNSCWLHGTGELPADWQLPAAQPAPATWVDALRVPTLAQDGAAWLEGWRQIDVQQMAPLLGTDPALGTTGTADATPSRLVLCGERRAITLTRTRDGLWRRLRGLWHREASPQAVHALLASL